MNVQKSLVKTMAFAWLKVETTPVIALKLDIMEEIVNSTFVHVKMEEYAKIYLVVTNVSVKTAGKETIVTRFPKTGQYGCISSTGLFKVNSMGGVSMGAVGAPTVSEEIPIGA